MTSLLLASTLLTYSPDLRIPFEGGGGITVGLWHWQAKANTNVIRLYVNGVYDSQYDESNGVANILLEEGWKIQSHASNVNVGVVDNFNTSHGSFVSSVVELVAPGVKIHKYHTFSYDNASVSLAISNSVELDNCSIINLSFGYGGTPPVDVINAITHYTNVLFVTSALNSNGNQDTRRDAIADLRASNVIVVNTFSKSGTIYASGSGSKVSLSAPGRRVIVADANGNLFSASGTSYAAPHVSGIAALVREKNPSYTVAQIKDALEHGANKSPSSVHGLISAWGSLYWNGLDKRKPTLSVTNSMPVTIKSSTNLIDWEEFDLSLGDRAIVIGNEFQRYWKVTE